MCYTQPNIHIQRVLNSSPLEWECLQNYPTKKNPSPAFQMKPMSVKVFPLISSCTSYTYHLCTTCLIGVSELSNLLEYKL